MSIDDVSVNTQGLDDLLKMLKGKVPSVKIGVLGDNKARDAEGGDKVLSNATIGRAHEFGLGNVPERSFLRMPLIEKLDSELEEGGFFDKGTLKEAMKEDGYNTLLNKMGILAVKIVDDAFDSEGFGMWPKSNMANKENEQTLTETGQLRRSISYEVSYDD